MNLTKRAALIFGGLSLVIGMALCSPPPSAVADIPVASVTGTISATGTTPVLSLGGQTLCALQPTGAGTMTVTFQGSADNVPTFQTISGQSGVAISAGTQYAFNVTGTATSNGIAALTYIRMNVTVYGGTPVPYTLTCTGGTGFPAPAGTGAITANTVIVAPTDAAGNVKTSVQNTPTVIQGTSPWVVTTPAPDATNAPVPMATASTGAVPTSAPLVQSVDNCVFSNGVPAATAGNYLPVQCNVTGIPYVIFPGMGPLVTPTSTPVAAVVSLPVQAAIQAQCGTAGLLCLVAGSGTNANGASRNSLNINMCNAISTICMAPTAAPADATANATAVAPAQDFLMGFNGTTWDRARKDTSANGPLWVTTGGSTAVSVPTNATTVVKGSAGRLVAVLITTLGAGTLQCYDNATTGTGTIIADFGASAAVGTIQVLNMPAANGITCVSSATGPVATVSFY